MRQRVYKVLAIFTAAMVGEVTSGCTFINFGIGSLIDDSLPDSVSCQGPPFCDLSEGDTLVVVKTSGLRHLGEYLGHTSNIPSAITVRTGPARYDPGWTGWVIGCSDTLVDLRVSGGERVIRIPLRQISSAADADGRELSEITRGAFEPYLVVGDINTRVESLLLSTTDGIEQIPFNEINEVKKRQDHYAKFILMGVGFVADAAWMAAVSSADFTHHGW
jgi:hypothetical protein